MYSVIILGLRFRMETGLLHWSLKLDQSLVAKTMNLVSHLRHHVNMEKWVGIHPLKRMKQNSRRRKCIAYNLKTGVFLWYKGEGVRDWQEAAWPSVSVDLSAFPEKKKNARSQVSLAGVEKLLHKVSPATPIDSAGPGVKDILHWKYNHTLEPFTWNKRKCLLKKML